MTEQKYLALLFLFSFSILSAVDIVKTPSFELLTGVYNEREEKWRDFSDKDLASIHFYAKNYYEKIGLLEDRSLKATNIPKVLHFIWIGPRPFPEESVMNVESWKKLHPDWTIKFWTDSKDRPCPVEGMQKHLIQEIPFQWLEKYLAKTKNYAEKADLIRYELLYDEGGVYVDHDVFCLREFDNLAKFDFYATLENPHRNAGTPTKIFPCNCLIGTISHHPIIRQTIREVCERWDRIGKKYPDTTPKNTFARVINRTFRAFTLGVQKGLGNKENNDIIFPACYFFPDKMLTLETKEKLFEKGFVYASHAFASTWRNSKVKPPISSESTS